MADMAIHVMLDRQGIVMNLKKLRRLYREEKATVRKRGGRKRALGTRRPLALASRPNERWSYGLMFDGNSSIRYVMRYLDWYATRRQIPVWRQHCHCDA